MANTSESNGNNSQTGSARNENSADGLGRTKESTKTQDPQAAQQQLNTVEREPEQGRIAADIAKYDAETHERIERIKKEIAKKKIAVAPAIENEAESIQPSKQKQRQAQDNASIEREDALAAPSNYKLYVPPEIGSKYLQVGNKYHNPDTAKTIAFVDRGDKLQTASSNPQIADDLVKIADARGWQELKVTGTPAFRREVWLEASVRGIHVDGYKPTELDKAELERRSTFVREQNSIEVPSNAFRGLPKEQALKKDPGLVNAFATIEAAKVFAQQKIPDSADQEKFVSSVQQEVGKKVDAGEKIPAVKLKTPEGKLIAHGKDHYNFDKDEKLSYYVTLEDSKGRQRILWGVGLGKAVRDSKAQIGDRLRLQVSEQKGVVVDQKIRDQNNKVIGSKTIDSARNVWSAEVLPREQTQVREQSAAPRSR